MQTHDLSYNGIVPVRVGGNAPANSRPASNQNNRDKNYSVQNSTSTPLHNVA